MVQRNAQYQEDSWSDRASLTETRACEGKASFRTRAQAQRKLNDLLADPIKSQRNIMACRVYFCDGLSTPTSPGGCYSWHLTSHQPNKPACPTPRDLNLTFGHDCMRSA
jgi:hypothetical protein